MMDDKHKELVAMHRSKIVQTVEVDKLRPYLEKGAQVLGPDEVAEIEGQSSRMAKVEKLLDVLSVKGGPAYENFLHALKNTYPHFFDVLFMGGSSGLADSRSTSMTSDSEDDVQRHPQHIQIDPSRSQEIRDARLKIIPSSQYEIDSTASSSSYPTLSQSPLHHSLQSPVEIKVSEKSRDYDWLKEQCEHAIKELQSMKGQHAQTVTRYDQATKEADHYRNLYKTSLTRQTQLTDEIHSLKSENLDVLSRSKKLEQEVGNLHKLREEDKQEIAELRIQYRKVLSESGSSEVLNEMYDTLLDKYETLKNNYDRLREQYDDVASSHGSNNSRLEKLSEENESVLKKYEEMRIERDMAITDRNGFKQQCTSAIRNWNQVLNERKQLNESLAFMTQQRDKYVLDYNQALAKQINLRKEKDSLQNERDACYSEYRLIMSERDTVHKEIEQLHDKLVEVTKKVTVLEKDKKSAEDQAETLKREVASALQDRDKCRRECNDISGMKHELEQERDVIQKEFSLLTQERDIARQERHQALERMDHIIKENYEITQKKKAEEMDHVAKETESLKKQIEKLKQDLSDAAQEAEIAKKRRDWAFGERDKIVQERESIRTLCDNLRRERDRAVSDLAQALRDSDELKKQKNEAFKELKEIKEKYEAVVEREAGKGQLNSIGHNHSRDSAIDADLQEWECEMIDVELEMMNGDNLGFDLIGGKDDPQFQNDPSLFVYNVMKGGVADGKLRLNDIVLKVNGRDVTSVEKRLASQAMREHSGTITLVVKRRKWTSARIWQPLQLLLSCHKDPGMQIEHGLFISRMYQGGIIAKDGMLPSIGDRIVQVNSKPVSTGMSAREAMKVLEKSNDPVQLQVLRQVSPVHSAGSSPTPTSQAIMSTLPDHSYHSNQRSQSDTIPQHGFLMDDPMTSHNYSHGGNKTSRSHSSQTDSLDSSGASRKSRDRQHGVKEVIRGLFRQVQRSNESQLDVDERGSHPYMSNCNLGTQEKIIAEFDPVSNHNKDERVKENSKPKSRKTEFEIDSNSGTWPKSSHQPRPAFLPGKNTVVIRPHPGKERPPLRPDSYIQPSFYDDKNSPGRHFSQNSDSSIRYGQEEPRSLFTPPRRKSPVCPPMAPYSFYNGQPEIDKVYVHSPLNNANSKLLSSPPPSHTHSEFDSGSSQPKNVYPINNGKPPSQSSYPQRRQPGPGGSSRPTSIDFPIGDIPSERLFENRIPSPITRVPPRNSHHPNSQPPAQPPYRSGNQVSAYTPPPYPPGSSHSSYPAHYRYTMPPDFQPFHFCPVDYSSPSISQQSNSTIDRITPTFSEDVPPRYSHYGRHTHGQNQGSVEIVSGPSSPGSSLLKFEPWLSEEFPRRKKPRPLDMRTITIQKTAEQFGIQINAGPSGGIFISSVNEKSLAAQAGLVPGDQLLEVCGINMRTASYAHALTVLKQCGDNLIMRVQYNPDKYREPHESSSTGSMPSVAGTITSSLEGDKSPLTITHMSPSHGKTSSSDNMCERPRYLTLKKRNTSIGFSIVGGNATGIFVHEPPQTNTNDVNNTLQRGDQILEYNGLDFRGITAEQAVLELSKPCSTMRIRAQLNLPKYNKVQNLPGDSVYIRANFERAAESETELAFRRDDIMLVENTLHGGGMGLWFAWLVNDDGKKLKGGTIPSRMRLEDDMVLRRSLSESVSLHESDDLKGSRRGSGTYRRSFFRKKRHQRNNSKESRELSSFSDASLNSDSVPLLDDSIYGYTIMERIECKKTRPVVLLAPLAEPLIRKLESESPDKYHQCKPSGGYTQNQLNQNMSKGVVIDYWRRDDHFECVRVTTIEEICDKRVHCLLKVSPAAVERLHHLKIYPIVIFVRHKNWKQIREIRDVQFLPEKLSNKASKDIYEQHLKIEQEHHNLFSATIQGGNLAEMCMHIKTVIASEQKKPVWVSAVCM
ncbi:LOW QUALITY PROTEIN: disks large homolog 5-like [Haliotis cracherodii]|uniref:LOW QUALITY PROTEIN: disks large homolog 5-like n=1 Tax=Haliotis cracherodii TaxID=6455 RepID=UPI0039E81E9E